MKEINKQMRMEYEKEEKKPVGKDGFAENVKPLEELLDSIRHLEGCPIGEDEDILALSDPPYYTACPNPYINDFIEKYGKPYDPERDDYHRTPFVGDISEGKNDPIYNAHSYHTKVPHKAIMKFIEHYTEEGDIVFDGFCGTGMTGVAAQLLNRRAVLADLSPSATFIAYNLNTPVDVDEFEKEARRILAEVEEECGWMYETLHTDGKTIGRINYTVWSDVFICPYCQNEYVFWHAAVDKEEGKVQKQFNCPECQAAITKNESKRATVTYYDKAIGQEVTQAKQEPMFISYTIGKKRFEKEPDQFDLDLTQKIEESAVPYWFPTNRMPEGDESRRNDRMGITHVHHFYTKRNLWVLSSIYNKIIGNAHRLRQKHFFKVIFTSLFTRSHKMNRYMPNHNRHVGPLSGTLYVSFFQVEISVINIFIDKLKSFKKMYYTYGNNVIVSTQSITQATNIFNSSIDYIFTDPPFGGNLMYSELNYISEAWLRVYTNNKTEAVINDCQQKTITEYKELMNNCFKECYRRL